MAHEQGGSDQPIPDDIRAQAKALGLDKLTDADLRQFMKAAQVAQSRRSVLDTRSLVAADEPAHVYRLA